MLAKPLKFVQRGMADAKLFLELYRWLWRFGAVGNKAAIWQIVIMETIGAMCLIGALLFLLAGLNLVDYSRALGEYSDLLRIDVSSEWRFLLMIVLLGGSVPLYYLSAYLSLRAALKARFIARNMQTRMTKQLLSDFAAADGSLLSLDSNDQKMLSSSFTFGPQICGVALETLLRAFRPMSQLLLIGVALIAVQIIVIFLLLLLGLILTPLIYAQQRKNLTSSEKVYGGERKEAHRAVITILDSLSEHITPIPLDNNALESGYLHNPIVVNAMDEYDKWKLAVDRGQFMMDIGRVIVLYLLLVGSFILTEMGLVSWPILVGLILAGLRIQSAMSGLMIRVVALVRFVPVLRRVRRIDNAFRRAALAGPESSVPDVPIATTGAYAAHIKCYNKTMRKELIGEMVKEARRRLNRVPVEPAALTTLVLDEVNPPGVSEAISTFAKAAFAENAIYDQVALALLGGNTVALIVRSSMALHELEIRIQKQFFMGPGDLLVFSSHKSQCKTCWNGAANLADKANLGAFEDLELM